MKNIPKIIAFLIITALTLSLCACGEPLTEEKYICRLLKSEDSLYAETALAENGAEIILRSDGNGSISYGDKQGNIKWTLNGEIISLKIGEEIRYGSLKNGIICLNTSEGVSSVFVREDLELYPEFSGELPIPGEYYGWWEILSSEGAMPETWLDCCGKVSVDDHGIKMKLWDEDGSEESPMAELRFERNEDELLSSEGYFWYSELEYGQWIIDTKKLSQGEAMEFTGTAKASDGGSFSYRIYLKPWGDDWAQLKENSPDMLPFKFESWYMPLINAHEPMPGKIE